MTHPLKVSLDVSAVPLQPAGAGRYVLDLLRALDQRTELSIDVISRKRDDQRFAALAPHGKVHDFVPDSRPRRLLFEQTSMGRRIGKLGVEVHHGPHYTMPRSSPVPTVVTIHDLTFFDRPELHERSKVHFFRGAIAFAAAHASALVCVSQGTADRFHDLFTTRAEVFVAPHGIDHARFTPTPARVGEDAECLERLDLANDRRRIVMVGTLEPRKGIVDVLSAFEAIAPVLNDVDLIYAGQRGWGLEEFDQRLNSSPFAQRVKVLGYVSDEEVASLLRTASVVAYPSVDEGFGLPALEGLACGAPVVTTEGSVMAQLCGDAPWLVRANDVHSLTEGLRAALDVGEGERSRRRQDGFTRAALYTWTRAAEIHEEAYRSAVAFGRAK